MNKAGDANQGLRTVATLWTDYFENQYDEKNYKVIKLLTKKSGLKLDKDAEYAAGLLWTELYDLFGAIGNKSIKNINIAKKLVELLAEGHQVQSEDLWRILNNMSGKVMPHGIFLELYELFDPEESFQIKDQEAIKGFILISNKIWQNTNLGYFFDNLSSITSKT